MRATVANPYYTLADTVNNTCQGTVTLFDHPTFSPDVHWTATNWLAGRVPGITGDPTWRFTAHDFIIIDGQLKYEVVWVVTKAPTSDEEYAPVTAAPANAASQKELNSLLAKYEMTLH
jgi:hypothetical protein